jgi:two-component sensor histidine kinase
MQLNRTVPPIVITDYSILGKKAAVMRQEEMLNPIHLGPRENMITFNFAALNFSNAFLNQYAYKLEGFDEDWIYCGHNQTATYTNLNGGSYVFRVKGANNDGVWNETGTSVSLVIHPPFWRTWWFYLLCVITVGCILYTVYRIRINQLLKMQAIRARIARDLHDDIGSTLSSINMLSSMADQSRASEPKSKELFHIIAAASGQAMDMMSDIVWSINPENDRMERSFIRMRQYASEMLEAAGIAFTLEMNAEDNNVILPLEIRKDFFLIFKEAINNLAKYSKADTAVIRLLVRDDALQLIIQDNGVGFDTAKISPGNGLKNMHTRARQMHGMLNIISGDAIGTRLELAIPLSP